MLDKEILKQLQEYIETHLISIEFNICEASMHMCESAYPEILDNELHDFINNKRKPTFKEALFGYIDSKGVSDADIYKRAGIDRRHFSKIRSNANYKPGKNTAIALSLALELNEKETDTLLSAAGYSLSDSETFDLVIQFCVNKKIYDIRSVNEALDYFSLKPLIGVVE